MNNPFEMEENNPFEMEENPFSSNNIVQNSLNNEILNTRITNSLIEIWVEELGRKKNTYISGWIDDNLKEHIKIIKKQNGCNGTIKDTEDNKKLVMFQGNQVKFVVAYFNKLGIDNNNIYIKG